MKQNCEKCQMEIIDPGLSEEHKLEICSLVTQGSTLLAIKKIKDEYGFSLTEAKGIILHFNGEFGKCHRCGFEGLQEEKVNCPNCKSFNYNLKIEYSFNQKFCDHLERELDFDKLGDYKLKGFWCDGVNHIPIDVKGLSKERMRKNKEIKTRAWIGKDGQDVYEMTIRFGDKSLLKYSKNESLLDCIPEEGHGEWMIIQPETKKIEVRLL